MEARTRSELAHAVFLTAASRSASSRGVCGRAAFAGRAAAARLKTSRQQHANGCRLPCGSHAHQHCSTLHTCHSGRAELDAAFDSCSGGGGGYSPASEHNSRLNQPRPCQRLSFSPCKEVNSVRPLTCDSPPAYFHVRSPSYTITQVRMQMLLREELSSSATSWSASCNHPGRVFHADEQICIRWF